MEVGLSKGIFSRRRNVGPPRRERVEEIIQNTDLEVYNLAHIKNHPGDYVFPNFIRPIHGVCPSCVINSQAVIHRNYLSLGSHSCFELETANYYNPFYMRMMPELFHFLKLPNIFTGMQTVTLPEVDSMTKLMFENGKLTSGASGKGISEDELGNVSKFISLFGSTRLSHWITNLLTKINGWIFGKLLAYAFEAICVQNGELEMIRTAMETGLPIIFVPVHRSHLDPFLISWVLLSKGFRPPSFIAPHSLMETPILGRIGKMFGGLGSMHSRVDSDLGYQCPEVNAALLVYFSLFWKNGNSVVLPVEPHRSKTGKPSTFLLGSELFNVLLQLYKDHKIEDAYIVPVSVNYDILPEEDFLANYEVSEKPLKAKFRHWLLRFNRNLGFARVAFSQPFRLREFKLSRTCSDDNGVTGYANSNMNKIPTTNVSSISLPGAEFQWFEENGSVASVSSVYGETDFIEPTDETELYNSNALVNHSLHDAVGSTVLMSTHLVAFLLLKKYRHGVTMEKMVLDFEILAKEIRDTYKHDIGFTGKSEDVVDRAIELLGSSCIQKINIDGKLTLKPDPKKCSLVKLNYYAGYVTSLLVMRGVIAAALFTLLPGSVKVFAGVRIRLTEEKFSVQEPDLIAKAVQIAELLKGEFLLHAPCQTTTSAVQEAIEKLKDLGHFQYELKKRTFFDYQYEIECDSDPDEVNHPVVPPSSLRIFINNSFESMAQLSFYRSLVVQYLEFYAVASHKLRLLVTPNHENDTKEFFGVEDINLRKEIYAAAERNLETGLLRYEELNSMDTIRNFLNLMGSMGVIRFYANIDTRWKKVFYLAHNFESVSALNTFTTIIYSFCTR